MNDYIYVVKPIRQGMPNTMTETEERIVGEHFNYLKNALEKGTLLLAGPCEDGAFGIVVFQAESLDAAEEFMAGDPAVKQGVMSAELHAFRISLMSAGK